MNQEKGRFEKLPPAEGVPDGTVQFTRQGCPTLSIGEIVEIKGIKFVVRDIKVNGRLSLKMLKIQPEQKDLSKEALEAKEIREWRKNDW